MIPDADYWVRWASLLTAEACGVVGLAAALAGVVRPAAYRRWIWLVAVACLGAVWSAELLGARAILSRWGSGDWERASVSVTASAREWASPEKALDPELEPARQESTAEVVWPAWVWLAGALAVGVHAAMGRVLVWRCRRRGQRVEPELEAVVQDLAGSMGLGRVRVEAWPEARVPLAYGIWWRTVVLPCDFGRRFPRPQQEAMLAHELAHLRGRDPLWMSLAWMVCALAWWQPAVWWARGRLESAMEAVADESSRVVEGGREALAEALVRCGRRLVGQPVRRGLGMAGTGNASELARRVKALLDPEPDSRVPGRGWVISSWATAGVLLMGWLAVEWPWVAEAGDPPALRVAAQWARGSAHTPSETMGPRPISSPGEREGESASVRLEESDAWARFFGSATTYSVPAPGQATSGPGATRPMSRLPGTKPEGGFFLGSEGGPRGIRLEPESGDIVRTLVGGTMREDRYVVAPEGEPVASSRVGTFHFRVLEVTESVANEAGRVSRTEGAPEMEQHFRADRTRDPAVEVQPPTGRLPGAGSRFAENIRVESARVVGQVARLSAADLDTLRSAIGRKGSVMELASMRITARSGQSAGVEVHDPRTVVTGVELLDRAPAEPLRAGYHTQELHVGSGVDLVPSWRGDAWAVELQARTTEFLGYDDAGQVAMRAAGADEGAATIQVQKPAPRFRVREASGAGVLRAGEALLLRGPAGENKVRTKRTWFRGPRVETVRVRLYYLVTLAE